MVAIFAAPIDLRKKFIFACILVVPKYGDSIKARIKVRTTQKVSNQILKWPILEKKTFSLFVLQPRQETAEKSKQRSKQKLFKLFEPFLDAKSWFL